VGLDELKPPGELAVSVAAICTSCAGSSHETQAANQAKAAADDRAGIISGTGVQVQTNDGGADDRSVYSSAVTRSSSAVQAALISLGSNG
jgi:hypothetical protein